MSILSEYSLWFLLICLLLGVAYAAILYYKNRNIDFEKRSLWVMAFCRGVVIILLSFLLLASMVKRTIKQLQKPILVFAVDHSESVISTKDSSYYRTEYPKQLNQLLTSFGNDYEVVTCLLGESERFYHSTDFPINFDFTDKRTDLSSALDKINSLYANRNLGAAVLLSDGLYNTGSNPYYRAEKLKYPVYTVGLGDTELQTDFFISEILHNKQTYKGNFFPVEIKIAANKLSGKKAWVIVSEEGQELFKKEITISSNQYFETLTLSLEAKEKGIHRYMVALSEMDGEISYKNNSNTFFVEVIESKEKIALVYQAPHPDIGAIHQTLKLIDKYQVDAFSWQEFTANVQDYSLIVLHQLPGADPQHVALVNKIMTNKVSILFVMGPKLSIPQFNSLNTGLQISQSRNLYNESIPYYNTNFTSFTFSEEAQKIVRSYPPLRTFFGDYKMAVSSSVFLYQKISSIETQYPLVLFNDVNSTKIGIVTGDGLWQWRMHNYLLTQNHDVFDEIINKMVQLLSVKNDRSFFRVFAEQVFNENDEVSMTAELYNDSYELVNEPDVMLLVSGSDGTRYEARFSKERNAYSLNMGRLPVGNYTWQASVRYGNKTYSKNGAFSVKEVFLESANLVADHVLLQNIAYVTNAKFYTLDQLKDLEKDIKENENITTIVTYAKRYGMMLDSWWYFIVIILLFTVEWFMRRWGGGY